MKENKVHSPKFLAITYKLSLDLQISESRGVFMYCTWTVDFLSNFWEKPTASFGF